MKRICSSLLFFILCVSIFAKSSKEPDWFKNYKTIYPEKHFIAQRGRGNSEEESKTESIAQIARYFNTQVNANLSTNLTSISKNNEITEETKVINDVEILSQIELFAVEFTDPYYYKKEKKWYCVAYIDREKAWNQFKPQIEIKKSILDASYKKAEIEEEPFLQYSLYKQSWKNSKDFLEKLEFGRLLNPVKIEEYENSFNTISEISTQIYETATKVTISLVISGDYGNIFKDIITKVFRNSGFAIGQNGLYTLKVNINSNSIGIEPLSISPSIEISLVNKKNISLYNYSYKSIEKEISYSLENAQRKAYPKLAEVVFKELQESLRNGF